MSCCGKKRKQAATPRRTLASPIGDLAGRSSVKPETKPKHVTPPVTPQ